jgi:hypothetical protein
LKPPKVGVEDGSKLRLDTTVMDTNTPANWRRNMPGVSEAPIEPIAIPTKTAPRYKRRPKLPRIPPKMSDTRNRASATKKMIFAMPTAAPSNSAKSKHTRDQSNHEKGNHQMQHGLSSQSAACTSKRQ